MENKHTYGAPLLESLLPAAQEPFQNLHPSDLDNDDLFSRSKHLASTMVDYKELMMVYSCAIKEIRTKFEVLNAEFNIRYQRNPINFINNLKYMGIGMLVIFAVIGVIALTTVLINKIFAE